MDGHASSKRESMLPFTGFFHLGVPQVLALDNLERNECLGSIAMNDGPPPPFKVFIDTYKQVLL